MAMTPEPAGMFNRATRVVPKTTTQVIEAKKVAPLLFFEALPDGGGKPVRVVRLLKEIDAFLQDKILADDIRAVTAGENGFEPRLLRLHFFGQITSGHAVGHDEVREQQVNFIPLLAPDFERGLAGVGFQDPIAVRFEDAGNQLAHRQLVFDHKNGFRSAAGDEFGGALFGGGGGGGAGGRQEDVKGGADIEFAGDFNPTLVLLDNPIDRGEAKAGAFANFLGGEERLEDAREILRFDTAPRVDDTEAGEAAGPSGGMPGKVRPDDLQDGNIDG